MNIPFKRVTGMTAVWMMAAIACGQNQQPPDSTVTTRTIRAVGYRVGGGVTTIDLKSTGLIANAGGKAKVEAKPGVTTIWGEFRGLTPPTTAGSEFLTYVLWAVSPDGRALNLGEVVADNSGDAKLRATTQLQSFSLFVTAEPYWSVRLPSEMLVLENDIRQNTKGRIFVVDNYRLLKRSQYEKRGNPLALSMDLKNVPLDMYEARNSVEIAKARGADSYAKEVFSKAEESLKMAENALARKSDKKEIRSLARQTAQFSEDARALAVERQEQERIENERLAAAAKAKAEAEAKAAKEAAEAKRKADQEARRQAEVAAARQAQLKAEAAAREAQMKAEADLAAAKAKAEADALKLKEEAAKAEAERQRQAAEQQRLAAERLRAQLLDQLNRILETRDTPRGLIVTMADVLFDTGKYNLRTEAREKLARLSGIVAAHPGLTLTIEGYTDITGSDELNMKLSQHRADAVRDYLVQQSLDPAALKAIGLGKANPVADNATASGRQKNRRVELIVSGEVIGVKLGTT